MTRAVGVRISVEEGPVQVFLGLTRAPSPSPFSGAIVFGYYPTTEEYTKHPLVDVLDTGGGTSAELNLVSGLTKNVYSDWVVWFSIPGDVTQIDYIDAFLRIVTDYQESSGLSVTTMYRSDDGSITEFSSAMDPFVNDYEPEYATVAFSSEVAPPIIIPILGDTYQWTSRVRTFEVLS